MLSFDELRLVTNALPVIMPLILLNLLCLKKKDRPTNQNLSRIRQIESAMTCIVVMYKNRLSQDFNTSNYGVEDVLDLLYTLHAPFSTNSH